jgi:hypothetical protein
MMAICLGPLHEKALTLRDSLLVAHLVGEGGGGVFVSGEIHENASGARSSVAQEGRRGR